MVLLYFRTMEQKNINYYFLSLEEKSQLEMLNQEQQSEIKTLCGQILVFKEDYENLMKVITATNLKYTFSVVPMFFPPENPEMESEAAHLQSQLTASIRSLKLKLASFIACHKSDGLHSQSGTTNFF